MEMLTSYTSFAGRPPVLVVDEDPASLDQLAKLLQAEGYGVILASGVDDALLHLHQRSIPVVVADIGAVGRDGTPMLQFLSRGAPSTVAIVTTRFGSLRGVVEAIQQGAFDYLIKPVQPDVLRTTIPRALRRWEGMRELGRPNLPPASGIPPVPPPVASFHIGRSAAMQHVYRSVAKAAMVTSTVLISGESGTGKKTVARAIHENSPRRGARFIAVHSAALPDELVDTELAGDSRRRGLFEEADGGTLFFDQLADASPTFQAKLLRHLHEREYCRSGSQRRCRADVRVIVSTRRDLGALVVAGRFRQDLYYRLRVLNIELPPLRERGEDVVDLIQHFLYRFSACFQRPVLELSTLALRALVAYRWPGNVRELEHAIEHAVVVADGGRILTEDLPCALWRGTSGEDSPSWDAAVEAPLAEADTVRREIGRPEIERTLREVGFNKSKAAKALGIDRSTLYRMAKRLQIALADPRVGD